jgi:hypothetical protein
VRGLSRTGSSPHGKFSRTGNLPYGRVPLRERVPCGRESPAGESPPAGRYFLDFHRLVKRIQQIAKICLVLDSLHCESFESFALSIVKVSHSFTNTKFWTNTHVFLVSPLPNSEVTLWTIFALEKLNLAVGSNPEHSWRDENAV